MAHFRTAGLILLASLFLPLAARGGKSQAHEQKRDYPIRAVPFTAVEFTDDFWSRRIDANRRVTIPHNFYECETTGRIDNFVFASGMKQGKHVGYQFNDSDIYKVIEGASYALMTRPDRELDRTIDSIVVYIAAAQETDGYLYTPRRLIRPDYAPPGGAERWVGMKDGSHELYCAGHLYEAAVAHFLATGKRTLLDVALRNADLVCATFGPGKRQEVTDHQEIEVGLCKLYRVTGDEKYLRMAKWFLDERGDAKGHPLLGEYAQDDRPIVDQPGAEGHAVRAAYMYAGMADVTALTGDDKFVPALDRFWKDVVNRKLYLTGGIGATGRNEGFDAPYALPNFTAYCETCASIALALWSERMFLLKGDAQYVDVLERVMYNAILSGVSMSGDAFFYPNPLGSFHGAQRSPWFGCACCPPNVIRFIAGAGGYLYAAREGDIYVNLFASSRARVTRTAGDVTLTQETRYPWDGTVRIRVEPAQTGEFALCVRIPGWAAGQAVPGTLYGMLDTARGEVTFDVNGAPLSPPVHLGYAVVRRAWTKGDEITIRFPMDTHRIIASDSIEDDRGKVALQRGPLVYCLEGADAPDGHVTDMVIPDSSSISAEFLPDLLGGVTVLHGRGLTALRTLGGEVVGGEARAFTAIPYYAWAHRGKCEMTVWAGRTVQTALPFPAPTLAWRSTLSASNNVNAEAVRDQLIPKNSSDQSIPYTHWWPHRGTTEWLQYDFPSAATVSRTSVYWYDDTGDGDCRVPKAWRILYKEGKEWKPVAAGTLSEAEKDRPTEITFTPVHTSALRLEMDLRPEYSAGIFEWKVE
ncbi:MAG TPA: beta-L-arabinofuranosidase domain-containing protein [Bacteroidota bacterium]|nr:beta-L-arabinofuranosidase domain-containing protein [Bacteroidota bacterium]